MTSMLGKERDPLAPRHQLPPAQLPVSLLAGCGQGPLLPLVCPHPQVLPQIPPHLNPSPPSRCSENV